MCGVVSIIYAKDNKNLGKVASFLLKKLEYRGYDSTGAAFVSGDDAITLRKRVGAPSVVTRDLKLDEYSGRKFIGQVRWATFGSVTDTNAQPHEMSCFRHIVGAHNGNIGNTDSLKEFLVGAGHKVLSDNDGEMLIHMVEHFYDEMIKQHGMPSSSAQRVSYFKAVIRKVQSRVIGSYAACFTVPGLDGIFALKSGSSLYAGKGHDENGDFVVVSSDLTSVLAKTRYLIPMQEGEGLYFTHDDYHLFSLSEEKEWRSEPVRSRLNVDDISLRPEYGYFMEQEIFSSAANVSTLMHYYLNDASEESCRQAFDRHRDAVTDILNQVSHISQCTDEQKMKGEFLSLRSASSFANLLKDLRADGDFGKEGDLAGFRSENAPLLSDLMRLAPDAFAELYALDLMTLWKKKSAIARFKDAILDQLKAARKGEGRVFFVASGTSYHASLVGGYFFNNLAKLSIIPVTPGGFRGLYLASLRPGDMVVGVSQSGETKDLIDVFNDIRTDFGDTVTLCSVVNNENSTLPLEKSKFYLPIMCGSEIAVAATKSFTSQIALFYFLALSIDNDEQCLRERLESIRHTMSTSVRALAKDLDEVADRLFLQPSIHILGTSLIGLAKEAALKIREVVINHTEGYDSAEFKHGPNTILGKNTVFGFKNIEALAQRLAREFVAGGASPEALTSIMANIGGCDELYDNYPLVFICPPDARDKRITISQIHTHKIRGADIILIAPEDEELRKAVCGMPANVSNYYCKYIPVTAHGDRNAFVFEAVMIMQYLAFKMSVSKGAYLDARGMRDHGVHPDVPKNVSKSITVD